ncbi:MAG: hypothetical protein LLG97_19640, partial [Deltaproteobacteria bacterium]|nr:hypothetical protein [Deltaproteobacteria bacterium]
MKKYAIALIIFALAGGTAMAGPRNTRGAASTATALAANGANCPSGQAPLGVDASGAVEGCFAVTAAEADPIVKAINGLVKSNGSAISAASAGTDYVVPGGNVATATALAADPANCAAGQIAVGITAAGVAECTASPSGLTSVGATTFTGALTGNASTASALAANGANCNA